MRILYLVHQFFPEFKSGTEAFTLRLAKEMQSRGHTVAVLTTSTVNNESNGLAILTYEGLEVIGIPASNLPESSQYDLVSYEVDGLRQYLSEHSFDLYHVTHPMRMIPALDWIIAQEKPYILTLTDFFFDCHRINRIDINKEYCDFSEYGQRCESLCSSALPSPTVTRYQRSLSILEKARFRICPSAYVESVFERAYPDSTFRMVPHGIDITSNDKVERSKNDRDFLLLGFLGSIIPIKGLHVLLRAFTSLDFKKVRLVVVGPIYNKNYYREVIAPLISRDPRINYIGTLDNKNVRKFLRSLDVLCMPSIVPEAASLTFNEAMLEGTPVLGGDIGYLSSSIKTTNAGLLAEVGDVKSWRDQLVRLTLDKNLLPRLKHNIIKPPSFMSEANSYEDLYLTESDLRGFK